MSLLPFGEKAIVSLEKLTEYVLSETHEEGKNKARVFRNLLEITKDDACKLKEMIQTAVLVNEAKEGKIDRFGKRYSVDFEVKSPTNEVVTIRTGWIVRNDSPYPNFVTCFVLKN